MSSLTSRISTAYNAVTSFDSTSMSTVGQISTLCAVAAIGAWADYHLMLQLIESGTYQQTGGRDSAPNTAAPPNSPTHVVPKPQSAASTPSSDQKQGETTSCSGTHNREIFVLTKELPDMLSLAVDIERNFPLSELPSEKQIWDKVIGRLIASHKAWSNTCKTRELGDFEEFLTEETASKIAKEMEEDLPGVKVHLSPWGSLENEV